MGNNVNVKVENQIAYIGMNRPNKRNSLATELVEELLGALRDAEKNPEVRAIILYGEGKAFSAGGDIDTLQALENTADLLNYMQGAAEITNTIKNLDKLVVAAVHGFAAGAGFSLALACDFVVAHPDTRFISSFTNVGLIPDLGLIRSLNGRVPSAIAKEWIVSGRPVSVEEASKHGLVNKVATGDVVTDAAEYAQFIVAAPPLANKFVKYLVEHANEYSNETSLMQENVIQSLLLQTEDNREGIQAFFEKRKPKYKGI